MSKTILPAAYGEGNGNPLQCSCLENPTDRGAWQAAVHGVSRVRHNLGTKPPPPPPSCLSQTRNNHHWFCSFAHSVPIIPYIQFISQSHWFDIQNVSQTQALIQVNQSLTEKFWTSVKSTEEWSTEEWPKVHRLWGKGIKQKPEIKRGYSWK